MSNRLIALTFVWTVVGLGLVAIFTLSGCVGAPMDIRPPIARLP